jgi:predicted enzyme related to lactoylglutathione lyase
MAHIDSHPPGNFSWLELATTDQNAAKAFYSGLFGWQSNDMPMGPGEFYTMFQLQTRPVGGGYTLRKDMVEQGVPPHWGLYIAVANADATAAKVAGLGGKVTAPPFDVMDVGRMAVVQDPAGATFEIWEPKRHKGIGIGGVNGTLVWADLSTPDAESAKAFYSGLFGWTYKGLQDHNGYQEIQNGGKGIGGIPPANVRPPNTPAHWMPYFLVDSCDAAIAKSRELGGKVYMPPSTIENIGRMAILADPQGAVFALFEPSPSMRQ